MPTKTPAKKVSAGKANALQKPLQPSEELAAVVGSEPVPRGQVVSKIWDYCDEPADPVCQTGDQNRLSALLFHPRSPHMARRARLLRAAASSQSSVSET